MMRTLIVTLLVATAAAAQPPAVSAPEPTKKKPYFFFRAFPDLIVKFDPETDKVVGQIKCNHGVGWGTYLSHDKKFMYVVTDRRTKVEVVDLAKMEIVDEHDFAEDGHIVRVSSLKECPGGKLWYVRRDRIKVNVDTFDILDAEYVLYNMEDMEVVEKVKELPRAIRSGSRISPCGTKWHVFSDGNIKIVDPKSLKTEAEIDLKTPQYAGWGPLSVRGTDLYHGRNPDAYRLVYSMRDPVKTGRTTYGIVDVSIKDKKITKVTEWGWAPSSSWRVSEDGKRGVGSGGFRSRGGGNLAGDPSVNLVSWNMETGRKIAEKRTIVRNGLGLRACSPDGKKAYLAGRGHEFWVFDENLEHIKTVEMPGEIDGTIFTVHE